MKGYMELEVPVKIVIALIVVMVVISFIMLVSRAVRERLPTDKERDETFTIVQQSFSNDDISRYIGLCYQKARERPDNAFTCYLLKGDMSGVDFDSMNIDCDNSRGFLIIRYSPAGGVVADC